jgi:cytochrome c oxidase subunit II
MEEMQYGKWLPPDLSTHGQGIDNLIWALHAFMAVLFIGWGIFMVYCLIRFRAKDGHRASYEPIKAAASKYIEVGVVIIEVVLLLGLSMPVWAKYKEEVRPDEDALKIRVVAQQFAWNIHYAGDDGVFGRTEQKLVDESLNPIGLDEDDPAAEDDLVMINQMYIPVGKKIATYISSKDVIHSFGLPTLRVKQDAIPGMEVPVAFQAKETGFSEIVCAQLCGLSHYRMRGEVHIVSQEEFDTWYEENTSDEYIEFDDF